MTGEYSAFVISIHAPHEGERLDLSTYPVMQYDFNPRSPRGGATVTQPLSANARRISIHAPHEGERHKDVYQFEHDVLDFNPRSPRGGATCGQTSRAQRGRFQSTLPTRGSDLWVRLTTSYSAYFNPRSPRGGATKISGKGATNSGISIHAPHEGERRFVAKGAARYTAYFNPRSPRGGATSPSKS